MRVIKVALERIASQIALYAPTMTTAQLEKMMADMTVVFSTGDGERHTATVRDQNRQRLIAWIRERGTGRRP
jgi:hypothetical protein